MRDIKFIGKHKNPYGDKWVHGYFAMKDGRHVIIMPHAEDYIKSFNGINERSALVLKNIKVILDKEQTTSSITYNFVSTFLLNIQNNI